LGEGLLLITLSKFRKKKKKSSTQEEERGEKTVRIIYPGLLAEFDKGRRREGHISDMLSNLTQGKIEGTPLERGNGEPQPLR